MTEYAIDTARMRDAGFDPATITAAEERNRCFERLLDSPLGDHLRTREAMGDSEVAGGTLLGSATIVEEATQRSPAAYLLHLGYCPLWTSIGGNVLLYDSTDRSFRWADHESFTGIGEDVTVPIEYRDLPWSEDNARQATILISRDAPERFLRDLCSGQYDDRLDELD
jgi:hypothetical protein